MNQLETTFIAIGFSILACATQPVTAFDDTLPKAVGSIIGVIAVIIFVVVICRLCCGCCGGSRPGVIIHRQIITTEAEPAPPPTTIVNIHGHPTSPTVYPPPPHVQQPPLPTYPSTGNLYQHEGNYSSGYGIPPPPYSESGTSQATAPPYYPPPPPQNPYASKY